MTLVKSRCPQQGIIMLLRSMLFYVVAVEALSRLEEQHVNLGSSASARHVAIITEQDLAIEDGPNNVWHGSRSR